MKIIIMLLFICVITSNGFSQTALSKGSYSIYGNISFSSTTTENRSGSVNEFTFNPSFGYFFVDNLFVGISVMYHSVSSGNY